MIKKEELSVLLWSVECIRKVSQVQSGFYLRYRKVDGNCATYGLTIYSYHSCTLKTLKYNG